MSISGTNEATQSVPFGTDVVATGDANANGTAATPARSNHVHKGVVANEAWTAYTPTLTQSVTVTKTVVYAAYVRVGRMIHVVVRIDATGAGTAANTVVVGLPIAAASSSGVFGSGHIYDSSTTTRYVVSAIGVSTTTVSFAHDTSGGNFWGAAPNLALASGDVIQYAITYEAAS